MIVQPRADMGKELLEHGLHGEHGRACIDRARNGRKRAHFAARGGVTLEHSHLRAGMREAECSTQPADAGADDGDVRAVRDEILQGSD